MTDPTATSVVAEQGKDREALEPPVPATVAQSADPSDFRPIPAGWRTLALAVSALLAVVVPLLATFDLDPPGRPVLAVAYVLLVPGVPLALSLRLPSWLVTAALAISSSLAVAVLYGTATIVGRWWQPVTGAWGVTLLALVLSVLAVRRQAPAAVAQPEVPAAAEVDTPEATRSRPLLARLVLPALVLLAGVSWWWSTQHLALDRAAALGLLPVVGWRFVLALVVVCGLTAYGLVRRPVNHALLTCCALLVALVGYGTVPVSDGAGSVPSGWVHVVFAQYISEHGTVPTGVDARFSWPGFFSAAAQLTALAGTASIRGFLVLAPVVYTMAALPGLLLVARAITRSWRWSWVAVFVYLFTNWYQQDYFSPQATAFVLYTTLLGTLLWLVSGAEPGERRGDWVSRARRAVSRVPALPPGVRSGTAAALGLVLALLTAAVAVGHQLTPMTLILALVVFTVTGQTRYRLLWFVGALVFAGWFSYGATDYWFGHLGTVFGDLGQVSNSVGAGVSDRLVGDPVYRAAQFVRIGWSLALFAVAAVGVLLIRRRPDVWLVAGLGCAPFGLLALQSYGGEGVIRSFLYASPVLAPLAALALRALAGRVLRLRAAAGVGRLWGRTAVLVPCLVVAALLLTFTRGLNVAFERAPRGQVAASEALRERVRPGDGVGVVAGFGLTPSPDLRESPRVYLDPEACESGDLDGCLSGERPRFVMLTITQERYGELSESRPRGWVWRLGDQLVESGAYHRVHTEPGAWLLELDEGAAS